MVVGLFCSENTQAQILIYWCSVSKLFTWAVVSESISSFELNFVVMFLVLFVEAVCDRSEGRATNGGSGLLVKD